jgi:hypothetical protein
MSARSGEPGASAACLSAGPAAAIALGPLRGVTPASSFG